MSAERSSDARGFREVLANAAGGRRTGTIESYAGGERIGTTVLQEGRVAWATCLYQPEELGTFLRRLGQVTDDHLRAASAEYRKHGGRRKLGRILQESGHVPFPVLRRCLLLHVRMALACMLHNAALVGVWLPGGDADPEDISFELGELFPEMVGREDRSGGEPPELAAALEGVASVPGYRASVLLSSQGEPMAAHRAPDHDGPDERELGPVVAAVTDAAGGSAGPAGIGEMVVMLLEGTRGAVAVCRAETDPETYLAVLLDPGAPTGVALHKLKARASAMARAGATETAEAESWPT